MFEYMLLYMLLILAYLHGVFLYNNIHEYAWSLLNKPINK